MSAQLIRAAYEDFITRQRKGENMTYSLTYSRVLAGKILALDATVTVANKASAHSSKSSTSGVKNVANPFGGGLLTGVNEDKELILRLNFHSINCLKAKLLTGVFDLECIIWNAGAGIRICYAMWETWYWLRQWRWNYCHISSLSETIAVKGCMLFVSWAFYYATMLLCCTEVNFVVLNRRSF